MSPALLTFAGLVVLTASCGTVPHPKTDVDQAELKQHGLRAVMARHLAQASALAQGEPKTAIRHLEIAFKLSQGLIDDRVLRAATNDMPAGSLKGDLGRVYAVARAQEAFASDKAAEVKLLLKAKHPVLDLTEARRSLLLALVQVASDPEAAKLGLTLLANAGLDSEAGKELQSLARTTAASIDFDRERLGPAIKAYLRVSEESGYWRIARTAISWALYQLGKYDRALAGLKLLPGGPGGDPERALLGAVCLHQGGKTAEAVATLDAALATKTAWLQTKLLPAQVLASIAGDEAGAGLVGAVAFHPPLRLLGREIAATDTALAKVAPDHRADLATYRAKAWKSFVGMVERQIPVQHERVERAFKQLEVLKPQLK